MKLVLTTLLVFSIFITLNYAPAYAEEEIHEQSAVMAGINAMFDKIGEFGEAQTNSTTWFDEEKKEQVNEVNDQGVKTGKTAVGLWWDFHEFVVKGIFAGSPIPFDVGIAVLISFVLSAILVFFLFKDFIKKTWKIGAVIVAVIAIILILGIENVTV